MFFAASKIVWFCLQPSSLILAAIVFGAIASRRGSRMGRRAFATGAVALVLAGLTALPELLIIPLENRFPRPALDGAAIDGIIVLGGAEDARISGKRELMALNEAGERITETVALARRFPNARIVFSGGSDALLADKTPEAETAGRLFAALGIDPARLILEPKSRNTDENARFTAALVPPKSGERWLLVTSAWHMPRAMGCFRQAGFSPLAWPVDYRKTGDFVPWRSSSSLPDGLRRLDYIAKEYVGLIVYRLTGRTAALLPAP